MATKGTASTYLGATLLLLGLAGSPLRAQEAARLSPPAVTAAATLDRVRFAAPNDVYEMRLEVFAADGSSVFDSDVAFGNVFDWDLRGRDAQPLADGSYLCRVTLRDLAGAAGPRWGLLSVAAGEASWQSSAAPMAGRGPLASDVDLVAASRGGAGRTTSLLAHDGNAGRLVSGSGGLSFRLGDFLAGEDVEQMRLTERGDLGIGVAAPQAKLDVGGLIRTSEGIRFPDGTVQTTAAGAGRGGGPRPTFATDVTPQSHGPFLAKFTSPSTIGDSIVFEENFTGNLGIGTTAPGGVFDLQRSSGSDILQRFWNTGGGGAKLRYVAATGATSQVQFTDLAEWIGSVASNNAIGLQFRVSDGVPNTEAELAASARLSILRNGDVGIGTTSPVRRLHVRDGSGAFGDGAHVQIGGTGVNGDEKLILFGDPAFVYIGERDFDDRLVLHASDMLFEAFVYNFTFFGGSGNFIVGGNVIPDGDGSRLLGDSSHRWSEVWAANGVIQTSDARLKDGITDLGYGLREVLQLRPVTFQWKDRQDGRQQVGLLAQEVQPIVPEVVIAGEDPAATLGMNYANLVPVVIKAVQEQHGDVAALAAENDALKRQNAALEARLTALEQAVRRLPAESRN